jgi:cyclic beta-1,2-glucan synthetase
MYRVGVEGILGITLERGALRVDPCIPRGWPGFEAEVTLGGGSAQLQTPTAPVFGPDVQVPMPNGEPQSPDAQLPTAYHIVVENPNGVSRGVRLLEIDGVEQADGVIPIGSGGEHRVRVVMG